MKYCNHWRNPCLFVKDFCDIFLSMDGFRQTPSTDQNTKQNEKTIPAQRPEWQHTFNIYLFIQPMPIEPSPRWVPMTGPK